MRPYRTVDDRIDGVIFTSVEITRLKRAEADLVELNSTLEQRVHERTRELDEASEKISQARDLFYALFHANPIPTALTRLEDDVFLNVNVEFLTYFNFQREEVIGHSAEAFNLGLGLGTQTREDFITRIKNEGRIRNYESEIEHPSGGTRNILASVQYINLDNTDALISTFIDITDRVRAEQQIRQLASELTTAEQAERHKLSQILHDDLQQRIFAVQMQLSFLREAYEKGDPKSFNIDFDQLEEWLREAIATTRRLSVDLSPPILHGEGLAEAILWLGAQMLEQYGLEVNVSSHGAPVELDEKVRVLLFYAVRELLFNIVKHAESPHANVSLEHNAHQLRIVVSDSGKGFDAETTLSDQKSAHGLLNIRHRLNLLGCSMEIKSEPGNGTYVFMECPYERLED